MNITYRDKMSVTRRHFLRYLALAGALFTGCRPVPPLRVSTHPFPPYDLVRLGSELTAAPLRWIPVTSASEQRRLLRFAQADAGLLTLDEALRERALGTPLVVVALIDISRGTDMLLARPGWTTPERLAQARIAVEPTGVGALTYAFACAQLGLTPDWTRRVLLPPAAHASAWEAGTIDAAITFEPFAYELRQRGAIKVFDSSRMPAVILDVIVAREEALAEHGNTIAALNAAWFAGLAHWQQYPEEAAHRLAALLRVAPQEVAPLFAGIELMDCAANRRQLRQAVEKACALIVPVLNEAGLGPLPPDATIPVREDWLPC